MKRDSWNRGTVGSISAVILAISLGLLLGREKLEESAYKTACLYTGAVLLLLVVGIVGRLVTLWSEKSLRRVISRRLGMKIAPNFIKTKQLDQLEVGQGGWTVAHTLNLSDVTRKLVTLRQPPTSNPLLVIRTGQESWAVFSFVNARGMKTQVQPVYPREFLTFHILFGGMGFNHTLTAGS